MNIEEYKEMRIRCFNMRVSKRKTKNGCILWKGSITKNGYGGLFRWLNGERLLAHRLAYEIEFGYFDRKFHICHKCDNPPCVNPQHLYAGTHQENMRDVALRGRGRKPLRNSIRSKIKRKKVDIKHAIVHNIYSDYEVQTVSLPAWATR